MSYVTFPKSKVFHIINLYFPETGWLFPITQCGCYFDGKPFKASGNKPTDKRICKRCDRSVA